jgi:sulfite reductase beta subunit-like hemoprotein
VGFIPVESTLDVARAVARVFRETGDRTNRKHARLKYVLEERGIDWFRGAVEKVWGKTFAPARPVEFSSQNDLFGWQSGSASGPWLGLFVENGRIADRGDYRLKTALRRVVGAYRPKVQLTPAQNLQLIGFDKADVEPVTALFGEHGIELRQQGSMVRRAAMACPSLPTCGLGLAESERRLPEWLSSFEGLLSDVGLGGEEITVRMTGCPNGCARPYLAEIGLVGRAPGKYQLYLGGNVASTRLNRLYRDVVKDDELLPLLRPLLAQFSKERTRGERFGDWACRRVVFEGEAR